MDGYDGPGVMESYWRRLWFARGAPVTRFWEAARKEKNKMPCCGQSRQSYYASTRTGRPNAALIFEYVGDTPLRVVGSVTGREYLFGRAGTRAEIDARDHAWVAQVPNLRRIM
jgi:hypothetical protein